MRSRLVPLLHLLTVVASVALLAYGYLQWSVDRRLAEAQRLHTGGSDEASLRAYQDLSRDLGGSRWKKAVFADEYAASITPQLELLYGLAKYDEAVDLADAFIQARTGDIAACYFWSGNALFQKGMTEDVEEDSFRWFNRAISQLRKALEEDRQARGNIRYNYELVKTAVEEVMSPASPERAKILRPRDTQQSGQSRKIAG